MYFITKSQWDKIGDDFKTEHSQTHGGRACFERSINPDATGTALLFEGLHFTVIPDDILTGDDERDGLILQLLQELSELTDDNADDWKKKCQEVLKDQPATLNVIRLAEKVVANRLSLNKPR